MVTYHLARFYVYHLSFLLAHKLAQEIVVVYLAQEADTLTVLSSGTGQLGIQGYLAYFFLHQVSDREYGVAQLIVRKLSQEIGLVLYRVFGCSQPHQAVLLDVSRVMSCGDIVVLMSYSLFEGPELDQSVAHHIRVGCQTFLYTFYGVAYYLFPVFLLQIGDLQLQPVLLGGSLREFDILFGRAGRILALHTYFDIVKVGFQTSFTKLVYHNGAIHTSGYQYGNGAFYFLKFHVCRPLKVLIHKVILSPSRMPLMLSTGRLAYVGWVYESGSAF